MNKDRIHIYPLLSPEERLQVASSVKSADPGSDGEESALLREMQAIARVLDEARCREVGDDEAAFVVAREAVEPSVLPYDDEVAAAIEESGALQSRCDVFRGRIEELGAIHDPLKHFESLRQEGASSASEDYVVREPRVRAMPLRRLEFRTAFAIAASVVFLLFSGALFVESQRASEFHRIGDFSSDELDGQRYLITARSADTFQLSATDSLFVMAVEEIQNARSMRLGLFPRYDEYRLSRAQELLSEVVDQRPVDEYVALEARYLRAKTHLLQDETQAAENDLRVVVENEGARSERARDILQRIRRAQE